VTRKSLPDSSSYISTLYWIPVATSLSAGFQQLHFLYWNPVATSPTSTLYWKQWHENVRTEEIQELFPARMHPILEHCSFSLGFRIRLLEQNLGLVIAYQPRAAVRGPGFNDNIGITTHL
jgi:hypothetical protein